MRRSVQVLYSEIWNSKLFCIWQILFVILVYGSVDCMKWKCSSASLFWFRIFKLVLYSVLHSGLNGLKCVVFRLLSKLVFVYQLIYGVSTVWAEFLELKSMWMIAELFFCMTAAVVLLNYVKTLKKTWLQLVLPNPDASAIWASYRVS